MSITEVPVSLWSALLDREQLVIGKRSSLYSDLDEFRGIPFGHVPGRWKRSELRTELPTDKFEAFIDGPKCPQPRGPNDSNTYLAGLEFADKVPQSEIDCLNLFIVRPSQESLERVGAQNCKLPVLIWIHGGAYAFGAGTDPMWDPSGLVQRSIDIGKPFIAINLNYRLNYFGFAASAELLKDQPLGCNFGLYDQKVGIKWVSRNIGAFGGDSEKITIAGQSAGAASTNVHALDAKLSAGAPMFRRVIMQSGSVGCLGPTPLTQAQENWDHLCHHFGLENNPPESRLTALREIPPEKMLEAAQLLGWETFPVVLDERSLKSTELGCGAEADLDCLGKNESDRSEEFPMEIMIGDTDSEGSIFITESLKKIQGIEDVYKLFNDAYSSEAESKEILESYGINKHSSSSEIRDHLTQFQSDSMFGGPLYKARKFFSEYKGGNNVRRTTIRPFKVRFGNPFKASKNFGNSHHCVELIYLFDAFHKALNETDSKKSQYEEKYEISTEMSPGSSAPSTRANSKVGSPILSTVEANTSFQPLSPLTNCQLRNKFQDHWIEFIIRDDVTTNIDNCLGTMEDEIVIYDNDHIIRVDKLSQNNEMKALEKRCLAQAKYPDGTRKVMMTLMKGSM